MQVIKNSTIYLGSSLINRAIPFLLLPILTKYLSPLEYGALSIFQIMISFSTAIVGMAINTNVAKNFFKLDTTRVAKLNGNIFVVLSGSTILATLVIFGISLYFKEIFSIPVGWVRVIPLLSFLFMLNTVNLTVLRMEGKAVQFGIYEVSNTVVNMGVTVLFLVVYHYGWYSRAVGITVAYVIFFFISMVHLKRKNQLLFEIDKTEIRSILSLSLPLIPHTLGGIVIAMSDRFFIERMIGLEMVGIYTIGYMFGMIVMLFTDAFIKAWTPWFFKKLVNPTEKDKSNIVKLTYLYILAIFVLAIGVSIASIYVLPFFVEESYYGALDFVFWIAIGYVFFGIYQIFFPYLVHLGKTSFLGISTVTAAVLNLLLNYILINSYGAIGAAYATIIAFIISATMVFLYQKKRYPMPWSLGKRSTIK